MGQKWLSENVPARLYSDCTNKGAGGHFPKFDFWDPWKKLVFAVQNFSGFSAGP
jgi:hypothetical protein